MIKNRSIPLLLFGWIVSSPVMAESRPVCPAAEVLAVQWAEAIASGALVSARSAETCTGPERFRDIRLPRTAPSEPDESELQPESTIDRKDVFRVEGVRNGELGTRVVRLSWRDAKTGRRVEDEVSLLLNAGKAAKELGCAGLYAGFRKHRVRFSPCR